MARVLYPAFLDFVGRRVLVVGAGNVAAGKIPRLVDAGANVVVVAPEISPSIEHLPIEILRRPFQPADLDGCWFVVSAAPSAVNGVVVREAARRGIFVNAVDDPRHASAFAGSGFRRGPVTVAISTGGDAPALARVMREALERLIGSDVEDWASLAARIRDDWRRDGLPMEARRDALLGTLAELHREQVVRASEEASATAETSIARKHANRPVRGFVSLVGAGPGDPELLTRKAARRLAEADLVLYDALVSPATVARARHAQRILVGRRKGSETTGQDAIIRTLIRAARRGRRVVRLKGGDPFVFGRGGEEALALKAAGVAFEIVPGVSSALAGPASAFIPVTHRGISSSVLVTTGHDPERFAELAMSVAPGAATLVILMGTSQRTEIVDALVGAGWRESMPAAIVWNASLPEQRVWTGTLAQLGDASVAATGARHAPGTIVIGDVVGLREWLTTTASWHELEEAVCHG
jgi:uroporphyrin-III C-methyltransferase/precorrin-2 dehydrogenase/sirohydrochlorin ferrochelatase